MAYHEWGDLDNPDTILCVHGLTRTGRDFDDLARRLAKDFRVVCPDVVGRGLSDRLSNPLFYGVPQYTADMVSLIARLQPSRLQWVGTSMGGLIGLAYAGAMAYAQALQANKTPAQCLAFLPETGLRLDKLVLNDVGPYIEPLSLERIGQYVGEPVSFDTFELAVAYVKKTAASFGLHTELQWQDLARYTYIEQGGKWIKHYDLGIATAFKAMKPDQALQGEQILWQAYASVQAPILIMRGQDSDLLSPSTLKRMLEVNLRARAVEFAGVGHAPTIMATDQLDIVCGFLYE
jgi:pimeloyl-ACP methyl ester carboxylesterase